MTLDAGGTRVRNQRPPGGTPRLRMRDIGKRFGAVPVLAGVDLEAWSGEVHVLAGENGAGKTTLIKILSGAYSDWSGTIELDGEPVRPRTPRQASALGIGVIHQEPSLVPTLGVADNFHLGRWPTCLGLVRAGAQRARAASALERFGLQLDPDRPVAELPPASRQLLEIAKALDRNARVIVMDEPTSALSAPEADQLHARIDELRRGGCAVLYITHRMEEIERLADRITVLRDGRLAGTGHAAEVSEALLLRWMADRDAPQPFRRQAPAPERFAGLPDRLAVEGLTVRRGDRVLVDGLALTLRPGEIVGLAGLQGAGASEALQALFGEWRGAAAARLELDGEPVPLARARDAIARGIALLGGDRLTTGLVPRLDLAANLTLPSLQRLSRWGLRRPRAEAEVAAELTSRLDIRAASPALEVRRLSGGNQQKVALAKWLPLEPRLLLLDDPTRGVDIGAKREIYRELDRLTATGVAVLVASSDLPELLALSDRVVVLHRGRVTARLGRGEATVERVLRAAMGEGASDTGSAGAGRRPPAAQEQTGSRRAPGATGP